MTTDVVLSCSPNIQFPAPSITSESPPSLYLPSKSDEPLSPFNEPEDEEIVNPFAVVADYQFDRQETPKNISS